MEGRMLTVKSIKGNGDCYAVLLYTVFFRHQLYTNTELLDHALNPKKTWDKGTWHCNVSENREEEDPRAVPLYSAQWPCTLIRFECSRSRKSGRLDTSESGQLEKRHLNQERDGRRNRDLFLWEKVMCSDLYIKTVRNPGISQHNLSFVL